MRILARKVEGWMRNTSTGHAASGRGKHAPDAGGASSRAGDDSAGGIRSGGVPRKGGGSRFSKTRRRPWQQIKARSPRKEEIRLGLKTCIIHRIRDRIFGRISGSSGEYRDRFRKMWRGDQGRRRILWTKADLAVVKQAVRVFSRILA